MEFKQKSLKFEWNTTKKHSFLPWKTTIFKKITDFQYF